MTAGPRCRAVAITTGERCKKTATHSRPGQKDGIVARCHIHKSIAKDHIKAKRVPVPSARLLPRTPQIPRRRQNNPTNEDEDEDEDEDDDEDDEDSDSDVSEAETVIHDRKGKSRDLTVSFDGLNKALARMETLQLGSSSKAESSGTKAKSEGVTKDKGKGKFKGKATALKK
ncbi:hypothetical protein NX059_012426 [Plenodomus lindquistii]|nr:hypothetical protein NX059_012426 [Plenodomus lindquistii]